MTYLIDTTTYDKDKRYPVGHGYTTRPAAPTTVVVHSTEGAVGQSLQSAANYLYHSNQVSADYLIGRGGEIIRFLDSERYQAWHAGGLQENGTWTAQPAYANPHSIGIECLHAQGETWPAVQKDALAWLLDQLIRAYRIPVISIETHGQIALPGPYKRKIDPTDWSHQDFIVWRDLALVPAPAWQKWEVIAPCSVVTARSGTAPLAGGPNDGQTRLAPGDVVNVGDITDGWLWVSPNPTDAPGIGFILQCYARTL